MPSKKISGTMYTLEAAKILGFTQRTIQSWCDAGALLALKSVGGHRRIVISSVNKLLEDKNTLTQNKV